MAKAASFNEKDDFAYLEQTTTEFGIPVLEESEQEEDSKLPLGVLSSLSVLQEDPNVVREKLVEMNEAIQKQKGKAYLRAEKQSRNYVENPDFRLKFLRADCFDVPAATRRFMAFFEQKMMYFGENKLTKDIELSDLSVEDLAVVKSGVMQEHYEVDASGRVVVSFFRQLRRCKEIDNMVSLL